MVDSSAGVKPRLRPIFIHLDEYGLSFSYIAVKSFSESLVVEGGDTVLAGDPVS